MEMLITWKQFETIPSNLSKVFIIYYRFCWAIPGSEIVPQVNDLMSVDLHKLAEIQDANQRGKLDRYPGRSVGDEEELAFRNFLLEKQHRPVVELVEDPAEIVGDMQKILPTVQTVETSRSLD